MDAEYQAREEIAVVRVGSTIVSILRMMPRMEFGVKCYLAIYSKEFSFVYFLAFSAKLSRGLLEAR